MKSLEGRNLRRVRQGLCRRLLHSSARAKSRPESALKSRFRQTCGGCASLDLKTLLEYEYDSDMWVESQGHDPYRDIWITARDSDTLVVVFKKVPHGPL